MVRFSHFLLAYFISVLYIKIKKGEIMVCFSKMSLCFLVSLDFHQTSYI